MATYGRGQMLGSGINPESFKQDYSGFARAAATQAQGIANLGANIGNAINMVGDENKQINQNIAKGKSALAFAKANYPELAQRIDEIGNIFSDPNVSKADQAAAGSQMGDFVTAMIRGQEFNTEIGLKKKALEIEEAQNIAELAAKNRENQAKLDQRISDSIFIGGRDVAVTKDGFGNIYDPKTDKLIIDQGAYQAGREDYGLPTNQSNQDTGDLLQRSLELNDPTFGSQEASNALFPDGVAPQGNPMPAGTPTTTVVPKVDGVPTPRGTPRTTGGSETYRPFTPEEIALYGSQGQVSSTGKVYTIRPPTGTKLTTNPDGSVTYETGAGVGGKNERAEAERQKQQGSFVDEFVQTAKETLDLLPNLPDNPVGAKFGAVLGELLPATKEGRVVSRLNTLKANLALDKINQMRAASPTGGAAGTMTVQEWPLFMQEFGSLDAAEDKTDLANRLKNASVKLFNRVNGTPEERAKALKEGVITEDQNKIVERQYNQMLSNLGIAPTTKASTRAELLPNEQELIDKYKTK